MRDKIDTDVAASRERLTAEEKIQILRQNLEYAVADLRNIAEVPEFGLWVTRGYRKALEDTK